MENNTKQKITTPMAIIIAGLFIMIGILLTKTGNNNDKVAEPKTLSMELNISKEQLSTCIQETDLVALNKNIQESIEKAMKAVPPEQRGTPYSIVVGKNGVMTDIRGAYQEEGVKKIIESVINGKVDSVYAGEVIISQPGDHIFGNSDAIVTIIEYSDYGCSYCKSYHETLNKIVSESNGNINWIYRHWPIQKNSFEKMVAAECVAKIKGNDAFWKYSNLIYGMLEVPQNPISDQL